MFWRAQPIFAGRTVVVAAGGPSLSLPQVRAIGMARASDHVRVVAINDAAYPFWFSDVVYACDKQWWDVHDGLPGFDGRRITLMHGKNPVYEGADWLVSTGSEGLEADPGGLRTAGNSGYQAINLCVHLGATKILLVGFDMRGTHWFGDHPDGCRRPTPNLSRQAGHFAGLVEPLRMRGIAVVNCSPGSAISAFPMGDLMTELKKVETPPKKPAPPAAKAAGYLHRQALPGPNGYRTR